MVTPRRAWISNISVWYGFIWTTGTDNNHLQAETVADKTEEEAQYFTIFILAARRGIISVRDSQAFSTFITRFAYFKYLYHVAYCLAHRIKIVIWPRHLRSYQDLEEWLTKSRAVM